mmetsp:Transcript_25793/g.64988  ORF Transcript_25793/g.64988 Transcript_25793/m.64988 type:complete len:242 (+) Transcript_25793:398-1123(+)|eukprot:CAMPEP_0115313392 /NCGR_PEP_ID=MMETSP0270-20121206/76449_1 /TAXON_ID=71861 /ORGANISM="Scrippsiella trochoidea, Strain CCMP3099" /LENGTH=241 /DNA_ID=CAMNT_0002732497 /DNA_START=453 /DNA_END=1178 /DNA_ORIENTATION=-
MWAETRWASTGSGFAQLGEVLGSVLHGALLTDLRTALLACRADRVIAFDELPDPNFDVAHVNILAVGRCKRAFCGKRCHALPLPSREVRVLAQPVLEIIREGLKRGWLVVLEFASVANDLQAPTLRVFWIHWRHNYLDFAKWASLHAAFLAFGTSLDITSEGLLNTNANVAGKDMLAVGGQTLAMIMVVLLLCSPQRRAHGITQPALSTSLSVGVTPIRDGLQLRDVNKHWLIKLRLQAHL